MQSFHNRHASAPGRRNPFSPYNRCFTKSHARSAQVRNFSIAVAQLSQNRIGVLAKGRYRVHAWLAAIRHRGGKQCGKWPRGRVYIPPAISRRELGMIPHALQVIYLRVCNSGGIKLWATISSNLCVREDFVNGRFYQFSRFATRCELESNRHQVRQFGSVSRFLRKTSSILVHSESPS